MEGDLPKDLPRKNDVSDSGDSSPKLNKGGSRSSIQAMKEWTPIRRSISVFMQHDVTQAVVAIAIVFNMVVVVKQADHDAVDYGDNTEDVEIWMTIADAGLLTLFIIELSLRLYVARWNFFRNPSDVLDFLVVMNDLLLGAVSWVFSIDTPGWLSVLRMFRIARLLRAYRILIYFPMLASMCRDLLGAMQAVLWGCVLIACVLTGWSIITVQVVHPLMKDLVTSGAFKNCERCPRAFSSVMNANLTYLQQVIAGDSWGELTVVVIEAHPWTALLFIGVIVSIQLAIMNVILALIVESAEEARKGDLVERMKLQQQAFLKKSKKLLSLCQIMDEDGSGELTLEELLVGFESSEELVATLNDMGLDRADMTAAFQMMDEDGSGTVSYTEFVDYVYKMKTTDVHTSLNFIRHFVMQTLRLVRDPPERLREEKSISLGLKKLGRNKLTSKTFAAVASNGAKTEEADIEGLRSEHHNERQTSSQNPVATLNGDKAAGTQLAFQSERSMSCGLSEMSGRVDDMVEKRLEELRQLTTTLLHRLDADLLNLSNKCSDKLIYDSLLALTANVTEMSQKSDDQAELLNSLLVLPASVQQLPALGSSGKGRGPNGFVLQGCTWTPAAPPAAPPFRIV